MPEGGDPETVVRIAAWHRRPGDAVSEGEPLCLLSVDGSHAEVASPADGTVSRLAMGVETVVAPGAVLAEIALPVVATEPELEPEPEPAEAGEPAEAAVEPEPEPVVVEVVEPEPVPEPIVEVVEPEPVPEPVVEVVEPEPAPEATQPAPEPQPELVEEAAPEPEPLGAPRPEPGPVDMAHFHSPAVRRLLAEHDVDLAAITGSGRDGRITRDDVLAAIAARATATRA